MSYSPNGSYFEELGGSPTMGLNTQGIHAMRKFWVPHTTDLTNFLQDVIGTWVIQGDPQQPTCYFQPPMAYPGFGNVVPSDIKVAPKMPDSPMGTFPVSTSESGPVNDYKGGWEVTVEYTTQYNINPWSSFQPAVPTGTYLTYSADLGAEMMITPGRSCVWGYYSQGDNGALVPRYYVDSNEAPIKVKEDVEIGILRPTGDYTLRWDRVLEPPWATIRQTRGHVNATTFMGAPPGAVLFLGAQVTRQYQFTDDGGFWQVEYKFSEKSVILNSGTEVSGWNYFFKPEPIFGENWNQIFTYNQTSAGSPGWQSGDGSIHGYAPPTYAAGSPLYASANFDELFMFDNGMTC